MQDFDLNMEDFDLATINMKDFEFSSYLNSPEDKENNATQPSFPEVNNSRFPSFSRFCRRFHPSFVNMKMGQKFRIRQIFRKSDQNKKRRPSRGVKNYEPNNVEY